MAHSEFVPEYWSMPDMNLYEVGHPAKQWTTEELLEALDKQKIMYQCAVNNSLAHTATTTIE